MRLEVRRGGEKVIRVGRLMGIGSRKIEKGGKRRWGGVRMTGGACTWACAGAEWSIVPQMLRYLTYELRSLCDVSAVGRRLKGVLRRVAR